MEYLLRFLPPALSVLVWETSKQSEITGNGHGSVG